MKNIFKKLLVFCAIIAAISFTNTITTKTPALAREFGDCSSTFLGMVPWDCNVTDMSSEEDLTNNIVSIASNILTDISIVASYLIIGFVIYGGYLYMFSAGDPGKAAAGKKTLTNAFIGLSITILAYTIFGAIRIALMGGSGELESCSVGEVCVTPETMIANLVQWVAGMGGVVAAIFVVIGGWGYITSAGDPGKLQKAKTTILYAFIGLTIVALAEIISAFVANTVANANDSEDFGATLINILNAFVGMFGLASVTFIIVGGVNYMTSAGDSGKVEKAKKTILYAVIGLIVSVLAFTIVNFVVANVISDDSAPEESITEG